MNVSTKAAKPKTRTRQPRAGGVPVVGATTLSSRVRRGDLLAADCPSREVLKHVTSRWGVLVLMALEARSHRFAELRRAVQGVSERMLAQTLQWLEGDGLVQRIVHDVVPPHVEYRLTPLGRAGAQRVRELADWIELNLDRIQAFQAQRAAAAEPRGAAPGSRVHRLR